MTEQHAKMSQSEIRRHERLAKALRENITRRKAQIRAREEAVAKAPAEKD